MTGVLVLSIYWVTVTAIAWVVRADLGCSCRNCRPVPPPRPVARAVTDAPARPTPAKAADAPARPTPVKVIGGRRAVV
jgi:hypothetical protein